VEGILEQASILSQNMRKMVSISFDLLELLGFPDSPL
jgi:hypothetical protein